MPQDSLRSIVYRSFVVCDDPKGVVESGMIRRSESDSRKMEHKNEGRKAQNRLDVCVASKAGREETVSKGPMEELHSSSSCQLLEVSRGAHKLNQVTNSWSGGIWCDRHSKDLAKDLLKGALELQDSLHMLGKLQEASHLARLKKKEKEKSDKVRNDQVIQGMHLSSVEERNYRKAIQNPHLSAGVSSRDCIEELREVIRDSLARQNLLPNINAEEKRCFSSRYPLDSASDIPSTSSSRSSSVQTDNFTSMESSIWSAAEEKKARGPSLIAKLMGLEEMPSKSWKTNSQKDTENKKIFSQQRPAFEIDTPKVRKPQYALRTEDPEKPLKDVLETMHFKVLLKSNSIKEIKPDSYQSSDFFSGSRLINNSPPIVLIKPRHDPYLQPEEKFAQVLQEEGSSNRETMLKKPKAKEDSPSKIIDSNNRGLNFSKTSRRLETKETPVKRHIQQEGAKDSRENKTRPARKEVKTKQSLSTRVKSSGSITQSSLKKVATEKNIDMIPKPMISSRKPFEKEVPKPKNLLRSKVQAKVAPQKSSKPENASNVMKSKVSHQPSATANSNSARKPQTIVRGPVGLKKSSTKKATEKIECKADQVVLEGNNINLTSETDTILEEKRIDLASIDNTLLEERRIDLTSNNDTLLEEKRIDLEEYSSATSDQLPREEGAEHIDIQIGEHCSESSVFDVTLVTFGDQNSRKSIEVDDDLITSIGTDCESFMTGTSLKALLLSSPAFINNVEELFDLRENVPTTLQKIGISGFSDADTRLSLDCANEIVRRRSNPDSQMIHPPWFSLVGNAKRHISLDHLLKETCDRVEALRSYSEVAGKNYPADSLYSMLERDINYSEVLSGIWDLGWRKGFSVDDTIQVVEDIEKQLLSGLIAEICA
ncbi:uncharacterized protein LOC105772686 [Gossypium raimondii]|uniref:DUF3741 domain-containing protein n=1 Tax=Gossypium raimondii TaxID=29730 RepID=A0A0D2V6X8_GOSRA|nr:uncharacterized protein LOC105772686 [Gossypium raimondii]XP_052488746.1 uncharacterized protein LOC105772686 [Gossypium raimondii]XP_052488747.1 uncharacterized protein LOC105772686 [Gossypium raimondii]KJB64940.1 hypothetical protein B456_010G072700 [Gossypium raimondii]KJB64941.1 hypothetical protein B456_010G072700 [Gossypium raimondii]MBA0597526.1 hypothetical protein [Gossypium raimondii]